MKVKKLLCLGMAALLMCSNLPQMEVHAQSDTQAQDYIGQNTEYAAETNEIVSGKCGENVYYEFNPSTETIRIYGEGAMDDGIYTFSSPWVKDKIALNIKKVEIEEGVTHIGARSFPSASDKYGRRSGCGNICSVEMADTVTSIGDSAFSGCVNLKSVKFSSSLKTIGSGAFQNTVITELKLPARVETIGDEAFAGVFITELTLPDQLKNIGYACFRYCNELKRIEISDNCEIGEWAFSQCNKLESALVGSNCTISGYVFYECISLNNISIGEGTIGKGVGNFSDCVSLQSILLPDSWESFSQFVGCKNLTDIQIYDTSHKYKIVDNVLYTKDGRGLIYYPAGLTMAEYEIPDGVTSIGECAFEDQRYLEYVKMPDGLIEIGESAFQSCSKLNYVIIPEGVQELGWRVFAYCPNLEIVVLPVSLNSIDINDGKLQSATFLRAPLGVIYGEEGSYAQQFAGDKFKQTIYCNFDPDGGTVMPQKKSVIYNDKYHKLPIPVKEKCKFLGWYTEYGTQVTDKTIVPSEVSHTLYAHWEKEPQKQISDCEIILSSVNYTYDGSEKKPNVTVKDGLATLISGTDYSITYSNNINAGLATVTITGIGNYSDTISETFTISAKSINEATVILEKTSYIYNGTDKQPSVTVKDGSIALRNKMDYTVSYSDNVNVGTATVIITGKGNYSGTTTKTFTISAQTDNEKSFMWGTSNWKFDNNSRYFSNYDVNNDVKIKMKNDFNLSNSEIKELEWKIAKNNESGFMGSCFGMTVSEIMAHQGALKLSRYGGSDIVNQNANTSNMTSVINFIQVLQSNSEMCQSIRQTPFLSGEFPQEEFINKLSDVMVNSNYLVKLSYKIVTKNTYNGSINDGYHAVLVYGMEKCNYYSPVTGKTYDRKVLIADPNYLSGNVINNDACLYFKSSDCSWIVPYWNITYSNGRVKSCYWNAENGETTNNGGIRNIMRYESLKEEVDLMSEFSAGHYIAGLEIDNKSQNVSSVEKVKNSGNPNADYTGDFSDEIVRYDMDMDDNIYMTENGELYALWNPTSSYTLSYLKPSNYNLKMDYETMDYYADVTNSTYTLFKPSGSITLKGSDADYDITMVTEDADCVTDWYSVAVSGTDVDHLVYTKVKNGYTLSASNLRNVKISAEGEGFIADVTFSTNYDDVFIYEIDKNTIGVKVDTDKNGTYETQIPTEETHQYGSKWMTDAKSHWKECKCGEKSELSAHKFKWMIDKKATIYESGLKHEECAVCGYKQNENTVIDKQSNIPIKGQRLTDNKSGAVYKVVSTESQSRTVEYTRPLSNKAVNISIPSIVKIDGISYRVTSIAANAFRNNKKITKVKIGSNITSIGKNSFSGCSKLKSLTIGNNVTSIGDSAFHNCTSIKKVTIPAKVKKIGKQAFCGCKRLKTIKINTKKLAGKFVGSKAFAKLDPKAAVKVPVSCLKSYKKLLQKKGLNGKKQKIKK